MTAGPLLDSQAETTDAIRTWSRSLAGVTEQVAQNDPQLRSILQTRTRRSRRRSRHCWTQVKPTLPILLANLTTVGQILVTYNPSLEQLLVLSARDHRGPAVVRSSEEQPDGSARRRLRAHHRRSAGVHGRLPAAVAVAQSRGRDHHIDTPDGLYCKLPQDSPITVRGARNYPCMEHPGKRAPTVELCNDPKGFQPLAMRQHYLGPYPFDPNLIAQGVPPDNRVDSNDRIFAPMEGTPLPPGVAPARRTCPRPRLRRCRCNPRSRHLRATASTARRYRLSRRLRARCPPHRVPSTATLLDPLSRVRPTTRRQASTSRRTVNCFSRRTWLPGPRPRRGRTCSRPERPSVQTSGQLGHRNG